MKKLCVVVKPSHGTSRLFHGDIAAVINPPCPAVDQTLEIRFQNLPALTTVRLETRLAIPKKKSDFMSMAHFKGRETLKNTEHDKSICIMFY